MWYKKGTHFYVAKNRKVLWNVMCLYYKKIFIDKYFYIIKYHIEIHINKNRTIREIHICYATSIIYVFVWYFLLFSLSISYSGSIQSSLQHTSYFLWRCRLLHCMQNHKYTIVPRSLISLFMHEVLIQQILP